MPLSLRPVRLPHQTVAILIVGVILAICGGLAIDLLLPQFAADYGMTAAVIAGAMTVPVSLLLAVYVIDYSRERERAATWQKFWAPVQESRLSAGSNSLVLIADQLLPSQMRPKNDGALLEVTEVRRWLPTIRTGVDSAIHQLGRFAETAENADLFIVLERLHGEHERYQSMITKFSADIDDARKRGDLEDGTTAFGFSPLDPISRKSDNDVIVFETGRLRDSTRDVLDICDDIAGRSRRPKDL